MKTGEMKYTISKICMNHSTQILFLFTWEKVVVDVWLVKFKPLIAPLSPQVDVMVCEEVELKRPPLPLKPYSNYWHTRRLCFVNNNGFFTEVYFKNFEFTINLIGMPLVLCCNNMQFLPVGTFDPNLCNS